MKRYGSENMFSDVFSTSVLSAKKVTDTASLLSCKSNIGFGGTTLVSTWWAFSLYEAQEEPYNLA